MRRCFFISLMFMLYGCACAAQQLAPFYDSVLGLHVMLPVGDGWKYDFGNDQQRIFRSYIREFKEYECNYGVTFGEIDTTEQKRFRAHWNDCCDAPFHRDSVPLYGVLYTRYEKKNNTWDSSVNYLVFSFRCDRHEANTRLEFDRKAMQYVFNNKGKAYSLYAEFSIEDDMQYQVVLTKIISSVYFDK